jgi:hypothetical protein
MVGAHTAVQQLTYGGSAAALAAGVNLLLAQRTTAATQAAGMLASDGRCKTLESTADGYVRSESCVVLHILAERGVDKTALDTNGSLAANYESGLIIHGTFVNQDGRSSSLTAPNGPSQQAVIRGALQSAGIQPAQMSALEMHGTGTPLGDPIEVGAALAVLQDVARPLKLSAAKSRMGHSEPAAGTVGIAQAAWQLGQQHNCFLPTLSAVNPHVQTIMADVWSTNGSKICLPRQAGSTGAGESCNAHTVQMLATGISAFAFQGTNAHSIINQHATFSDNSLPVDLIRPASDALFRHERCWCTPTYRRLLDDCSSISFRAIVLQCGHGSSALAYLHDHQVQGRPLLPATAMLELAMSASQLLLDGSRDSRQLLVSSAFTAPFLTGSSARVSCTIEPATGVLLIQSNISPGSPTNVTHMHSRTSKSTAAGRF